MAENYKDSVFIYKILDFVNDADIKKIQEDCIKEYPDMNNLNNQFNDAFKHYKYYYPEKNIPEIYTCVSGFNFPVYATDSVIAISLDMYLGENSEYYPKLMISAYKRHTMRKEYIIVDCIKTFAYKLFEFKGESNTLADNMIYEGKIMYFIDAILPDCEDTLKTGYSLKQFEWCKKYESKMWAYFVEKKLLFTQNELEIKKFVSDAPFTSVFPKESPGRTGVWLGWQIVKNYMKNNKVSLPQLMNENDANKILSLSRYKPKK
ncbi:MAG: hypothetical protein PHD97_11180 [Bacteroidales bacterium]|nr:hypothetical protein [Bacteroidales bacterium]